MATRRLMCTSVAVMTTALLLAACSGGTGDGGTTAAADTTLHVVATDMAFEPTGLTTSSGTVAIALDNQGAIRHNFVIEQTGTMVADAAAGKTDTGTVDLESGTYTFYCDVPGHREAGMEGTITVG